MAHKKGQGSSRNGRDSQGQRRGVKVFAGQRVKAGLGVAVGRRGVAVDRPEVALAVDQRVPQGEFLCHADQRVVDGAVTVWVIVLEHLAHDASRLGEGTTGEEPLLIHREQDATMDGLEAVAHVGQRSGDDDRHRVVEEGPANLVLDVDGRLDGARRRAAVSRGGLKAIAGSVHQGALAPVPGIRCRGSGPRGRGRG